MKLILAVVLAAVAAAPALAGEAGPGKAPSRAKKNPDEVICKMQQTAAGIPQRICATRREWARDNERTRQEMMLNQRGFCGGGMAC